MVVFKCKMCGGDLHPDNISKITVCDYCGSSQTVAVGDDEKKIQLFNRANRLRLLCDFTGAATVYENIISEFPDEAEGYWGLLLCKYGIEYVDDPLTKKKIPTCHRSSFDSIMSDSDFESVMGFADPESRGCYRSEAEKIEELRKAIIEISGKEKPYDIFICYKETDNNGNRTIDSVIAQDVYKELTGLGYRVFFSRISLEDKIGLQYEPYIFAALNSARIMLVFGTDYEYFNAVWVKNEWSRFLQLIAKGEKKHLIPCFKGIDAYDLPKEFLSLQAQDMGKIGAVQDLIYGIEKLLSVDISQNKAQSSKNSAYQTDALVFLKRGNMALEDADWPSALQFFENALNSEPENAYAYVGKALAEQKYSSFEDLCDSESSVTENPNIRWALKFASDDYREYINACIYNANKKREEAIETEKQNMERLRLEQEYFEKMQQEARRERFEIAEKLKKHMADGFFLVNNGSIIGADGEYNYDFSEIISLSSGTPTAFLKADGTVLCVGDNEYGECDNSGWTDIISVESGNNFVVGLTSEGFCVAKGFNWYNQCAVFDWENIIAVACGKNHTVGLKQDGTAVAVGKNDYGQCELSSWTDIAAVFCGDDFTVGLKKDGTVVAQGYNYHGQCNVTGWRDILTVSCGDDFTVGLKKDGTVVATGNNTFGQCDVARWSNVLSVSCGYQHCVGIKFDGTAVACGNNSDAQCELSSWQNVVSIMALDFVTYGISADGRVLSTWKHDNLSAVRLFDDLYNLDAERQTKTPSRTEIIRAEQSKRMRLREMGLCQHCSARFTGFFVKKCPNCGRIKDY